MKRCPNCEWPLPELRASVLVEALRLDADLLAKCGSIAPDLDAADELETFKLRMDANGYKVGKHLVRNARSAFLYHMKQAVKFAAQRKPANPTQPAKFRTAERKEL